MSDVESQDPPIEDPPIEDGAESANDSQADPGEGETGTGSPSTPVEVVISGGLKIKTESERTKAEDKGSKWNFRRDLALIVITALLVVVGGFQVFILYITNETLNLQQRA